MEAIFGGPLIRFISIPESLPEEETELEETEPTALTPLHAFMQGRNCFALAEILVETLPGNVSH